MERLQWRIQDFLEGVRQPIIWQFFAENCMKMTEIGLRRGCVSPAPPPHLGLPIASALRNRWRFYARASFW